MTFGLYSRYKDGLLIVGYGNGMIRMFDLTTGKLISEISAHCAWITGMDLASRYIYLSVDLSIYIYICQSVYLCMINEN